MKTKNYLRLTSFLSFLFKFVGFFYIVSFIISVVAFFTSDSFSFEYEPRMFSFFSFNTSNKVFDGNAATEVDYEKIYNFSGLIMTIPLVILSIIVYFKLGNLFRDLAKGDTPFTFDKAKKLRVIAYFYCVLGLLPTFLYPIVFYIVSSGDINITFGVGYDFIIGLILLVVAQVFQYGLSLQEFSEDVV